LEFLEYLTKLAPEGETLLIVRQKPKLKDGQVELHADGAVKAVWPAFYPDHRRRDGEAWYGNTASFIVDRFTDGKPSASAANCEYVLVMVLDDVGDPAKAPETPPLAPTWIMETSPGSFQWGYAFSEQPTKADYAAAIKAIAAAGYSDPGACNPVRNFRLPGSVNLKPGRNSFAAQLVEFHPEREYTLDEICTALNVTPVPVESIGVSPIKLADDGGDDVFGWLGEHGLVLTKPNREGWAGVVCPNKDQHTDGNPEGRYNPSSRAYCCLHSHCIELSSTDFLAWVAANGGPKREPGLREELIVGTMNMALAKLEPTDEFPDVASDVIEDVERRQSARVEREGWYTRYAYVIEDEAYFDLVNRREKTRSAFNAVYRHINCTSIHNGRKIEASVCFDENRDAKGAMALTGITYAAGDGVVVRRDGVEYGNRWRDARPVPVPGDAGLWLEHVERMVPYLDEREHLLNVLAYKIQNPSVKINHAVLVGGLPGSGKDTMMAPFFWAIGGDTKQNCSLVRNEELTSQWGYALECEVMEIAELRQSEARDRRALENSLKPIIAAPPDFLQINRKGLHPYMAPNRVLVVAFSNERAAISIPTNDRRWFCLWSDAGRLPEADARRLWTWYKLKGGFAAVASYLHGRDVSAFNPGAAPPMTEAKAIMIDHGRSTAESYLVELITGRVGEFAAGVVASPFFSLCDRLAGSAPAGVKIPPVALLHALTEAGWIDLGRVGTREHQTKKQLFCAPDMVDQPKAELRRMVEQTPAPAAVRLVK
jgi:hypothetical protein